MSWLEYSVTHCALFFTDMAPIQQCSHLRKRTGNDSHKLLHSSTSMTAFCAKSQCIEMKAKCRRLIYLSNFIFFAHCRNVWVFRHHVEPVNRTSIFWIRSTGVQKSSLTMQSIASLNASSRFGHVCTRVTIPSRFAVISTRVNILSNFTQALTHIKHSSKIYRRSTCVNQSSRFAQRSTSVIIFCEFACLCTRVYFPSTFRFL